MCTWPGNEANGLQCSGLFVARDRKLERRQRLKRVNPLPGGTTGATVSRIIQTITAILVCHCVSVCFFKQPISCREVRVYYFASTPSPSLFWSVQKQMLPLPSCKTLRHAHSRIVLSLVAEVTQEEEGDKHETCHETTTAVWNNPWDHCEDLCHCHTVSHPVT